MMSIFCWSLLRLAARETDIASEGNVSPVFEVAIKISRACVNGQANYGTVAVGGAVAPTFSIVECSCTPGWIGQYPSYFFAIHYLFQV